MGTDVGVLTLTPEPSLVPIRLAQSSGDKHPAKDSSLDRACSGYGFACLQVNAHIFVRSGSLQTYVMACPRGVIHPLRHPLTRDQDIQNDAQHLGLLVVARLRCSERAVTSSADLPTLLDGIQRLSQPVITKSVCIARTRCTVERLTALYPLACTS